MPRSPFADIRRFYEKGGYIKPKTMQALYGSQYYAAGGPVAMADAGSTFKALMKKISQSQGRGQARRLEQAIDTSDLSHYDPDTLRQLFTSPTGAFTTLQPSQFENYARPIAPMFQEQVPYNRWDNVPRKARPFDQSFDNYIANIRGRIEQGKISEPPTLWLQQERGDIPSIAGHEGRHRSRALAQMGDKPTLIHLKPDEQHLLLRPGTISPNDPRKNYDMMVERYFPEGDQQLIKPEVYKPIGVNEQYRAPISLPNDIFADGGRVGYSDAGIVKAVINKLRHYRDPEAPRIADWKWRPLNEVAAELPREVPPHVLGFGDYMEKMARKAELEGLDPRDVLKGYTTTLSSIQRQAIDRDKLPGLKLTSSDRMIRPEGAFSDWLGTPAGQKYLRYGAQGEAHPEAIADAQEKLRAFGLMPTLGQRMTAAPGIVAGSEGALSEQVARAYRGASHPSEWDAVVQPYAGIGPSKAGFFASLLGRGDKPTLDARQIILHSGQPTSEAKPWLGGKRAGDAVERLAERQRALDLDMPPRYRPFDQHLTHHTVWDAAGDEVTTHRDVIDAMLNRRAGGRVALASGTTPTMRQIINSIRRAAGWDSPVSMAANTAGTTTDEINRLIVKAPWMTGTHKSQAMSLHVPIRPYSDVSVLRGEHSPLGAETLIKPEDLKGSRLIGTVGDRLLTDNAILGLNGQLFDKPVITHGGPDYVRGVAGRAGSGWASNKAPIGLYANMAEEARDAGLRPVMTPVAMGRKAIDSTKEMSNLIGEMMKVGKYDPAAVAMFDDEMRRTFPKFPGLAHPDMPTWQAGLNTTQRSALPLTLDKAAYAKQGLPDVAEARLALTSDAALANPTYSSGRVMFEPTGRVETPVRPHPNYPTQLGGSYAGGFGRHVPADVMYPKDYKARMKMEAPDRSILMSPLTQDVDQQWIDNTSRWIEKANREGVARARGGSLSAFGGRVPMQTGGATKKAAEAVQRAIRAWHGSPHDFERFDPSKIGSGQGAQTFGYGHYLAESPDVARGYRADLAALQHRLTIDGKPIDINLGGGHGPENDMLQRLLKTAQQNYSDNNLTSLKEFGAEPINSAWAGVGRNPRAQALYDRLRQGEVGFQPGGKTYEVNIKEDPSKFLDWDKPLAKQGVWDRLHPNVRDAIDEAAENRGWNPFSHALEDYKGNELFQALRHSDVHDALPVTLPGSNWMGDTTPHRHTSAYLESLGLPGIRYLDQFSRKAGDGTRNYVVFPGSSDLIDIVGKHARGGRVSNAERYHPINYEDWYA